MIYNLKGRLTVCDANFIVVECGGIGFKCFTSLNTAKQLAEIGKEVNVYTHLAVREDAMDLYAFATVAELDAFKLLITVSGIGPKAGISILSELTPDRLALCIASGDAKSITKAQGIGKKTAERTVLFRRLVQKILKMRKCIHIFIQWQFTRLLMNLKSVIPKCSLKAVRQAVAGVTSVQSAIMTKYGRVIIPTLLTE